MRKSLLLVALFFIASLAKSQVIEYQDDFEAYNAGEFISMQNNTRWYTWSGQKGGEDDAYVSDKQAKSGIKSLNIVNDDDIVFIHYTKYSGHFTYDFNIYVKSGYGAYFNVEHKVKLDYAFNLYFLDNNKIIFYNYNDSLEIGSYTSDQWHNVKLDINIDADILRIFLDDILIGTYKYSYGYNGTSLLLTTIDFYGLNNDAYANSDFFIDDFKSGVSTLSSISEAKDMNNNFTCFPNPFKENLTIKLNNENELISELVLLDLCGNQLRVESNLDCNEVSISTCEIPAGIYLLNAITNRKTYTFKVIAQ
jgi:hypothetical protein